MIIKLNHEVVNIYIVSPKPNQPSLDPCQFRKNCRFGRFMVRLWYLINMGTLTQANSSFGQFCDETSLGHWYSCFRFEMILSMSLKCIDELESCLCYVWLDLLQIAKEWPYRSGDIFYRKSTIGTTKAVIEANNGTYCLRKRIEKFRLQCTATLATFLQKYEAHYLIFISFALRCILFLNISLKSYCKRWIGLIACLNLIWIIIFFDSKVYLRKLFTKTAAFVINYIHSVIWLVCVSGESLCGIVYL